MAALNKLQMQVFGRLNGFNISVGTILGTAVEILITPPVGTVDYYKVYIDGVFHINILQSGDYVTNLDPLTVYNIKLKAVFVDTTKYSFSNTVSTETLSNTYVETYEAEYEALLDFAIANNIELPNSTQRTKDNAKVASLKSISVWTSFKAFYYGRADYPELPITGNFYSLNWADPEMFRLYNTNLKTTSKFISGKGFSTGTTGGVNHGLLTGIIPLTEINRNDLAVIYKTVDIPNPYIMTTNILFGRNSNNQGQFFIADSGNTTNIMRLASNGTSPVTAQANENNHRLISTNGTTLNYYENGGGANPVDYNNGNVVTNKELSLMKSHDSGAKLNYLAITTFSATTGKQNDIYEIMEEI